MTTPLQYDRPLFVKVPFTGKSRTWDRQEHFPWKELSVDKTAVEALYNNNYLYHSGDLETRAKVGDGLESLDADALASVVATINEKVKAKTSSKTEYDRKRCKQSKINDKQRGLIRSWRRTHGQLEND